MIYGRYVSGVWNLIAPVADDGTADLNPRLMELAGGNAVCMWQDSNAQLGDEADLTTFNSHLEISVATYDSASGTWSAASRLTNDSVVDRSPNLAAAAQNDMLAVWVSNAANDTWGSATAPNTIMWSAWDGTAWSTPAAMATDMGTILDTVLAYNGTTGTFICVLDPDDTSTRRRTRSCGCLLFGWNEVRTGPAYKQFRRGCQHHVWPTTRRGRCGWRGLNGDDYPVCGRTDVANAGVVVAPSESMGSKDFDLVVGAHSQIALSGVTCRKRTTISQWPTTTRHLAYGARSGS